MPPPAWTASPSRTLAALGPAGTALRGVRLAPPHLRWPAKAPGDTLDYALDLSAWLAEDGDALTQVVASIAPAGPADLSLVWIAIYAGLPTLLLTGGVAGTDYAIALLATTAAGRQAGFPMRLCVN